MQRAAATSPVSAPSPAPAATTIASSAPITVTMDKYSFSFCSSLFRDVSFSSSLFFQDLLSILPRSKLFHFSLFVMLTGTF
jgi:hypothetical protein